MCANRKKNIEWIQIILSIQNMSNWVITDGQHISWLLIVGGGGTKTLKKNSNTLKSLILKSIFCVRARKFLTGDF